MKMLQKIKDMLINFEDLLFENHSCISCGIEVPDGTQFSLCKDCLKEIEFISGMICNKCGSKIINYTCKSCNEIKYNFDKNISKCYYNAISSTIIKKLKYSRKKYIAKYIAEMMCGDLKNFGNIDYITFVPVSKKGMKKRGFNQSEEIANEISKISNIPVIESLTKNEGFKNQARMNKEERLNNLKNAFCVKDNVKNVINNKNILIIDDVFTTGTTLSRCAKELKKCSPKSIFTMTFAKVK